MPDDSPPSTVWPALRARDARGLIRFLVDAFGFVETVAWGDQPDGGGDVVVHAQLDWPEGGGIMLGSVREGPEDRRPVEPGTAGCYVVTADPDAVHARAVAAGAEITDPLHDTDYGSRDFAARDPEGNRWSSAPTAGSPAACDGVSPVGVAESLRPGWTRTVPPMPAGPPTADDGACR